MTAQVTILGRVGRDAELRSTSNGGEMSHVSVAVDKGWGDKKKTIWWKILTFGKSAKRLSEQAKKGKLIMVSGEFDLEEYTDRSGVLKQAPSVVATNFEIYTVQKFDEHQQAIQKAQAPASSDPYFDF